MTHCYLWASIGERLDLDSEFRCALKKMTQRSLELKLVEECSLFIGTGHVTFSTQFLYKNAFGNCGENCTQTVLCNLPSFLFHNNPKKTSFKKQWHHLCFFALRKWVAHHVIFGSQKPKELCRFCTKSAEEAGHFESRSTRSGPIRFQETFHHSGRPTFIVLTHTALLQLEVRRTKNFKSVCVEDTVERA